MIYWLVDMVENSPLENKPKENFLWKEQEKESWRGKLKNL